MKFKVDKTKLLSMTITLIGIGGTILSSIDESNKQKKMKSEIVEEVMNELLKNKKES